MVNPILLEIESAKSMIIKDASVFEDSTSRMNSALFKQIENEADIAIRRTVIGQKNKDYFLKLMIYPKHVYEQSKYITFNFSEREG